MKALPYLTLALCAAFLLFQQSSVSSEAEAVTALQTRVDEAKSSGAIPRRGGRGPATAGAPSGFPGREGDSGPDSGLPDSVAEIDLLDLAEAVRAAETGGMPNMKVMMRIQTLVLKATPEELTELIRRTEALEVADEIKASLIGQFAGGLAEYDPKAALEVAFGSKYLDLDNQRWHFTSSFAKWAEQDPVAAAAWFDRELARGTFESKSLVRESDARLDFETTAVAALLDSNPSLARDRLLALPEDERRRVLDGGHRLRIDLDNAAAHARLVREVIPEDKQAEVLAEAARDVLHRQSYDDLATYVETVEASDAERVQIVEAAVERQFQRFGWENKTPTADDVAAMRTFLRNQAPEAVDRVTGEALAHFGGAGDNFPTAVELLTELHAAAPNDDALVGFLQAPQVHRNSAHDQARRELAAQITDPARRQQILDNLK